MEDIEIQMENGTTFTGSNMTKKYYFSNSYNEVSWIDYETN